MIKHWSATSLLALVLLCCFTGTKVEARKKSSGRHRDLPDPPYDHPYDPQHPPDQEQKNPSNPEPPYPPDQVFPPYVTVPPPNSQNPNVPLPWPFPPSSPSQKSQPPKKTLFGDDQNPLVAGAFLRVLQSDQPNPKFTQNPPRRYFSSSHHNVDSTSDHEVHYPMNYHSVFYPPPGSNPPNSKPIRIHQREPYTYYDDLHMLLRAPHAGQDHQLLSDSSSPTKPVNQPPSFPGIPVPPVYHLARHPSHHKKDEDQSTRNPSLSRPPVVSVHHQTNNPPFNQLPPPPKYPPKHPPKDHTNDGNPAGSIHKQRIPLLSLNNWFIDPTRKHVDQEHQHPIHQQQSVPGDSASPRLNMGLYYFNTKGKSVEPRGFADNQYSQIHQEQHPEKKTSVPYKPSVKQPNLQTCDVPDFQRIPCGSSDISASACEAISCCYRSHQCYFGKSVTVQCTRDAQFIVVVARDATLPNIDIETISLLADGPGCTQVDSNSAFSIFQFPVTACGSVVMEDGDKIIYENRMTSSYEVAVGPLGVITRDSSYDLLFQCRYSVTSVETVVTEIIPLQDPPLSVAALGPIHVQLRLGNGQCHTKGCNEVQVAYSSYYSDGDYPVSKILRDNVFVEVRLTDRTDPNLALTLSRCWTTTSASPHSVPQWDILINGCPNIDDRYISHLVPVVGVDFPSHYRRFIFKMLTFVDPNSLIPQSEHVYIHCSTSVCNAASGHSCEPVCYRKKRDVMSTEQTKVPSRIVVSAGPLVMNIP
ncbi:uncharacterized protein LOC130916121 [Corythoichthys intestinalis]|uniref:uncharacterized protein LOC130916121 n=1 Tax=Corythoichthys intestinalis TaxID=161448 RepID=UPI0025A599F6|nr:uncharacterized protein LOC130916121 [Corythoichthys intestinalis]XP_061812811.1 uncharacterized protein LOC133603566 [Nerophis lumbriciformis]